MARRTGLLSVAPLSMGFFFLNLALYVYSAYLSGDFLRIHPDVLIALGGSMRERLWDGDWMRLIAPNFLHGGILHIWLNGLYLYRMGPSAEVYFGSSNFGTLYIISGVAGFCFSQIFGQHLAIGASAALFGIMGAELCVRVLHCPRVKYAHRNAEVRQHALWIFVYFLIGISGAMGNVDNWAHLGGFIFGVLLAGFFDIWRTRHRLGVSLIAAVLCATVLLICAARWSFFQPEYHVHQMMLAREKNETEKVQAEAAEARKWARIWHREPTVELLLDAGQKDEWSLAGARDEGYRMVLFGVAQKRLIESWERANKLPDTLP